VGVKKSSIGQNDTVRALSWYERARSAAGWDEAEHAARERGRCAQGMGSARVAQAQASAAITRARVHAQAAHLVNSLNTAPKKVLDSWA
jgi:hypothetical protein